MPSPLAWIVTIGFHGAWLSSQLEGGTSAGVAYAPVLSASATPSFCISAFMLKCTAPVDPGVCVAIFTWLTISSTSHSLPCVRRVVGCDADCDVGCDVDDAAGIVTRP